MKKNSGFTLLEILLVVAAIAILAGVVIVALNPGKQLATTRNAARQSDTNTILNAIYQFSLDHSGLFPASIDSNLRMLGTDTSGCNVACGIGSSSVGSTGGISTTGSVSFTDNSQSSFNGTNNNTTYDTNTNLLKLSSGTSGTYLSNIKDAGSPATWSSLTLVPNRPIGKELPNNSQTETGYSTGNANMTGNKLLYHMNETGGALQDSSGNNNSATTYNGLVYQSEGVIGSGLKFDGVNDGARSGPVDVSDTNKITVVFWMKVNSLTSPAIQVIYEASPNYNYRADSYIASLQNGAFYAGHRGNNYYVNWKPDNVFQTNVWYHIAVIHDKSLSTNECVVYINGIKTTGSTAGFNYDNTNNFGNQSVNIGGRIDAATSFFNGWLDDFAIYNRVLSATEISDMYKRGALSLKHQIRVCTSANCSDGTFVGPDGTVNTYFSDINNSTLNPPSAFSLSNLTGRYFQYKSFFDTIDSNVSPDLKSVAISGSQTASGSSNGSTSSTPSNTESSCLDLSSSLVSDYINSIPFDPNFGSANKTYYAVSKTAGSRINVTACGAENGETVSVTR